MGAEAVPIHRTVMFRNVEGRQIADPYGLSCFACSRSIDCYRNRKAAGGWYPPLRAQSVLDFTFLVASLSKPLAECPLQSLRRQLPPQGSLGMYPFSLYVRPYCYRNREVEGRQIADPYGLKMF